MLFTGRGSVVREVCGKAGRMTAARDHLRALVEALPPEAPVTVPRAWLVELLEGAALEAPPTQADKLLTAKDVADRLGWSKRSVYRAAPRWKFTVHLNPKTLRFSERGLERWLGRGR